MTIEELAQKAGMSTANVRFYEQCGFLSPSYYNDTLIGNSSRNNYDDNDLDTLLKVRLLRELGISVQNILDIFNNSSSLGEIISSHLRNQAGSLNASDIRCAVCRGLLLNNEEIASLNPQPYLLQLSSSAGIGIPKNDRWYFAGPWRRYFARMFDFAVFSIIWSSFLYFAFDVNLFDSSLLEDCLDTLVMLVLVLIFEPLLLSIFGTTPGKFLLGMRVRKIGGGKLSYIQGIRRTFGVILRGMGLNIFIVDLICMWRARKAVLRREILPWETDNRLELYKSPWQVPAFVVSRCLLAFFSATLVLNSIGTFHRGDISPEEFAGNFSFVSELLDVDLGYTLTPDCTWEKTGSDSSSSSALPNVEVSSSGGQLTSVNLNVVLHGGVESLKRINAAIQLMAVAFIGAQPDVNIISGDLADIADSVSLHDIESFSFSSFGVDVSCQVESRGYNFSHALNALVKQDGYIGSPYFSLTFSMEKAVN